MALGELYRPTGLALETARAVLQVDDPWAVNVALGCGGRCKYCYGPRQFKKKDWEYMRFSKIPPAYLITAQLLKMQKKGEVLPAGVFISFGTDPLRDNTREITDDVIKALKRFDICNVATLSKVDTLIYQNCQVKAGMTLVSADDGFSAWYEPNAETVYHRICRLRDTHLRGVYTWVSMEPYPTPSIHEQDILDVLDKINFVDFVIFGKWNYDKRASGLEAAKFYDKTVATFMDYCMDHKIRYHVKSDTLKFIERYNHGF